MAVLASSGKVLPSFRKVAAMQRVLLFLDREEFLHGRYMKVIEESSPKLGNIYTNWSLPTL